jgi:uncharacterized protein DUF4440
MVSKLESKDREEIRRLITKINDAWVKGRVDELNEFFHEEMVTYSPGFGVRGEGKGECIKSYEDFVNQATVNEFKELNFVIDLWGDTGVATYVFEIAFDMNGQKFKDTGRDMFVLVREDSRWWAVWRTMIPSPPEAVE